MTVFDERLRHPHEMTGQLRGHTGGERQRAVLEISKPAVEEWQFLA